MNRITVIFILGFWEDREPHLSPIHTQDDYHLYKVTFLKAEVTSFS